MDEQQLMREHYEILADIRSIKEDLKQGRLTNADLIEKLEILERRQAQNDLDHTAFVKHQDLAEIRDSLRTLRDGMVIMTPKQAKESGSGFLSLVLKNPQNVMYIILGVVIIVMIIQGFSYAEISQALGRFK